MMKTNTWFNAVIVLMVLSAIGLTAYRFYFAKDYSFIVEASCDPLINRCFERDCTNPDDCPPNQFANYRIFTVNAADFEKCSDNSCLNECTEQTIPCKETVCGDSEEDVCAEMLAAPYITTEDSTSTPIHLNN